MNCERTLSWPGSTGNRFNRLFHNISLARVAQSKYGSHLPLLTAIETFTFLYFLTNG